jgi:hypothetical protein
MVCWYGMIDLRRGTSNEAMTVVSRAQLGFMGCECRSPHTAEYRGGPDGRSLSTRQYWSYGIADSMRGGGWSRLGAGWVW